MKHMMLRSSHSYSYDLKRWHLELLNIGDLFMLLAVLLMLYSPEIVNHITRNIKWNVFSKLIVYKGFIQKFKISISKGISGFLLDIKLTMDVCFFFNGMEKTKLQVPPSNANRYALFDDTMELLSKICWWCSKLNHIWVVIESFTT